MNVVTSKTDAQFGISWKSALISAKEKPYDSINEAKLRPDEMVTLCPLCFSALAVHQMVEHLDWTGIFQKAAINLSKRQ